MTLLNDYLQGTNLHIPQRNYSQFGMLYAPQTYSQLSEIIRALSVFRISIIGWRGQADINWPINNSAARRILKHHKSQNMYLRKPLEEYAVTYENLLIYQARNLGYGRHNGRDLADIEVLAAIQHFGAATRLLDFSENAFAALWFASSELPTDTGVLIGSHMESTQRLDLAWVIQKSLPEISITNVTNPQREYTDSNIWWKPEVQFDRMRSQQSIFIFGKTYNGTWTTLTPYDFDFHRLDIDRQSGFAHSEARRLGLYIAIAISPELKLELAWLWRQMFGYNASSMFPDLEGFSRGNRVDSPIQSEVFESI